MLPVEQGRLRLPEPATLETLFLLTAHNPLGGVECERHRVRVAPECVGAEAVEVLGLVELEHPHDAVVFEHGVELAPLDRAHHVWQFEAGRQLFVQLLDQRPAAAAFGLAGPDQPGRSRQYLCAERVNDERDDPTFAFPCHLAPSLRCWTRAIPSAASDD